MNESTIGLGGGGMGLFDRLAKQFNLTDATLAPRDPPVPGEPSVTIRFVTDQRHDIRIHSPSRGVSLVLSGFLQSRQGWIDIPGALELAREMSGRALEHLGIDKNALEHLATAGTLEILLDELPVDPAAAFPWEFVLAEATREIRQRSPGQSFLIVRHMPQPGRLPPTTAPKRLQLIGSAPGPLGEEYDVESEGVLISASLDLEATSSLTNPDVAALRNLAKETPPDIIHIAGVDDVQGNQLLQAEAGKGGMYISAGEMPVILPYDDLIAALVPDRQNAPHLIAFNLYNSSLVAAKAILQGAHAAIGFRDDIDDAVAELFFSSFYSEWKRSDWNLIAAFQAAWRNLGMERAKLRGAGIVLWSAHSLIGGTGQSAIRISRTAEQAPAAALIAPKEIQDASDYIEVQYEPPKRLNYSLLHNNDNLFDALTLKRKKPGRYKGIRVEVRLSVGLETATYNATFELNDKTPVEYVHQKVRVSLTSSLNRLLDESMFSTISTTVRWGEHVLLDDTVRVEFLPVDEWRYDALSGRWLPSFIFPRDPVIRKVIDSAQRYLVALRDDSSAGFDGYQSYDPAGATIAEKCRAIDAQVQAIWWALIYDYGIGYINPPPSFSDNAQRLRAPGDVLKGKRGTCIDLALLLASCLEYIEIYPVIFLLNDHAFPGYWRSERSYEALTNASVVADPAAAAAAPRNAMEASWMLGKARFANVIAFVQQGHIVPIETVSLTSRDGFWEAVEEGAQNLRNKRHFHSMFDLKTARKYVTPIPIWSKQDDLPQQR